MPHSTVVHTGQSLAALGRRFYSRGWVLGTSGNLSAVVSRSPLRLVVTASSVHKGELGPEHMLLVDERGQAERAGAEHPSAETLLHLEIVRRRSAGAVLHTHSVWSTILSDMHAPRGGLEIQGYEMLKGLAGVRTHERREWIPIVDNDQDMNLLSSRLGEVLDRNPDAHAVLLRRHGLYTWGETLADAERHVEILEFLFEALGRTATLRSTETSHGSFENS